MHLSPLSLPHVLLRYSRSVDRRRSGRDPPAALALQLPPPPRWRSAPEGVVVLEAHQQVLGPGPGRRRQRQDRVGRLRGELFRRDGGEEQQQRCGSHHQVEHRCRRHRSYLVAAWETDFWSWFNGERLTPYSVSPTINGGMQHASSVVRTLYVVVRTYVPTELPFCCVVCNVNTYIRSVQCIFHFFCTFVCSVGSLLRVGCWLGVDYRRSSHLRITTFYTTSIFKSLMECSTYREKYTAFLSKDCNGTCTVRTIFSSSCFLWKDFRHLLQRAGKSLYAQGILNLKDAWFSGRKQHGGGGEESCWQRQRTLTLQGRKKKTNWHFKKSLLKGLISLFSVSSLNKLGFFGRKKMLEPRLSWEATFHLFWSATRTLDVFTPAFTIVFLTFTTLR